MQDAKNRFILRSTENNTIIEIRSGLIIGRNFFPEVKSVSREHCRFTIENDVIFVEDLNSANSTWLNGSPLPVARSVVIKINDKLRVGALDFILQKMGAGESVDGHVPFPFKTNDSLPDFSIEESAKEKTPGNVRNMKRGLGENIGTSHGSGGVTRNIKLEHIIRKKRPALSRKKKR